MRASVELADIFRSAGSAYRSDHAGHLSLQQLKVMSAIEQCRTAALGGRVKACDDCGQWRIAYNSCRNRHCPKCQSAAARTWLAEREASPALARELLNVAAPPDDDTDEPDDFRPPCPCCGGCVHRLAQKWRRRSMPSAIVSSDAENEMRMKSLILGPNAVPGTTANPSDRKSFSANSAPERPVAETSTKQNIPPRGRVNVSCRITDNALHIMSRLRRSSPAKCLISASPASSSATAAAS
jgi:hypothetical protein